MYYYKHHIGDFVRDTSRLNDSQCMAYLRLLWAYYEQEQPLPNDCNALAFKIGANASDVHQILSHFFSLDAERQVWVHARCDREIAAYRAKGEKAKQSANARWNNANAMRTHSERNADATISDANHKPITNNHKKTKDTYSPSAHLVSLGADESIVKDWLTLRKAKKAAVTETAINGIVREAKKAMWPLSDVLAKSCERGWTGFKAEWVAGEVAPNVAAANPGELITLPDGRQITRAQQDFLKRVMA